MALQGPQKKRQRNGRKHLKTKEAKLSLTWERKVTQKSWEHRVPNRNNPKRTTSGCTAIQMTKFKDKERILNVAREKQHVSYKAIPIRLSEHCSTEGSGSIHLK